MRILYVTTIGGTMSFFTSYIKTLLDEGHQVDIATNENSGKVPECYREWGCKVYHIDTSRSPLDRGNLKAIRQMKSLVAAQKYDIVHCHTPIAAMCTRLACRKVRKNGTKVIYTAHGFHFYKGAPLKNWMSYYPVEKLCAHFTDVLITINQEDYALAQKKMKAKRVEYVPGVGIALEKFSEIQVDKRVKRHELGVPEDTVLVLSVGELNENKNHETVIRAIKDLNVCYVIAGKGELQEHLQLLIDECDMRDRVKLLGFRRDIAELCKTADIFVFPSFREGLPVSAMEAMASGLPCVASRIRGNVDIIHEPGGVLCQPDDSGSFAAAIRYYAQNPQEREKAGAYNMRVVQKLDTKEINAKLYRIYTDLCDLRD